MTETLSPSARRVQHALRALGVPGPVVESAVPTRTAADAARLVGCEVGQIVKSLVFRGRESGRAILVTASGANRVDERRVAALVGEPIDKADADFVREETGFAIGGVPPVAHRRPLTVFVDRDLERHDRLWAAAGTPNALFPLTFADLVRMTGGSVVAVADRAGEGQGGP
jgi:prolyl-tRNA editing enzyme YbaK/EbsC (Cys-tRNA(Pro) deacylase)